MRQLKRPVPEIKSLLKAGTSTRQQSRQQQFRDAVSTARQPATPTALAWFRAHRMSPAARPPAFASPDRHEYVCGRWLLQRDST